MTHTYGRLRGKRLFTVITAAVAALAMALTMSLVAAKPSAHAADNRARLRPGCVDAGLMYWVQRCVVHSNAMNVDIPLDIQPSANGGSGALILLDGMRANAERSDWINLGNAQTIFPDTNFTKVFVAGGESSFFSDWEQPATSASGTKTYKWETFLTQELPQFLRANFGVNTNRLAAAGPSMGGTGALNLAQRHPDMYKQVTALSPYTNPTGGMMPALIPWSMNRVGGYNFFQMWGGPFTPNAVEHDPVAQAGRLARNGTKIYLYSAMGMWNPADNFMASPTSAIDGMLLEFVSYIQAKKLEGALHANGINGANLQVNFPFLGVHNWPYWTPALKDAEGQIVSAIG